MPSPRGFDDPAVAALPPAGDRYFEPSVALARLNPGEQIRGGGRSAPTGAQSLDQNAPPLIFGEGKYTGEGEAIVGPATGRSTGHVSEILNFHGSPAPWILIGILMVAGILHLSAEGKFGFGGRV